MNCTICGHQSKIIFNKKGYDYYECSHCKSIFVPDGIDQSGKVGGEHEVGRNEKENSVRIERFKELVGKYGKILDWGCGHGYLVRDCLDDGIDAVGYDKFNPEFEKLPNGKFNLVSMVEVIEHTFSPFGELDMIYESLLPNGVFMAETSFIDVAVEEHIPIEEFFYISPEHGHCTIFSHYGLDVLMIKKGFKVLPAINRNVRIYQKK
jgi:2-polyprenyl-3-methyl-5-hydroxy-6-metoxy-1,4-benzoquinol methylase